MFGVQGQFMCAIFIDGKELPVKLGGFDEILVVENTMMFVPQFRMGLYDGAGILDGVRAVVDGTPVSILLGRSDNDNVGLQQFDFRAFGPPQHSQAGGRTLYKIAGVLDTMKYFRGAAQGGHKGRSSEVIEKIAADCSLKVQADRTNDEMMWLFGQRTYCSLAAYVAQHGWVDDKSLMALGLRADKTLVYRNLARLVRAEPKACFYSGEPDRNSNAPRSHTISYDIKSTAGVRNALFGYGSVAVEQKLDGSTTRLEKTNVTLFSDNVEMNSEVKKEVGRVRTPYVAPDAGNTHEKFQTARYQNRQGLSTFGTAVETLHQQSSEASLLDTVNFHISPGGNESLAQNYNGRYVLTAKVRCIKGQQYFEKHKLMTQGRQTDATGDLIG